MSAVSEKPRNPYGELAIYTHSFIVKCLCDRALKAARELLDKYSEKKWEKVRLDDGRTINRQVIDKRYGTAFPDGVTFQFHKGQLTEFKNRLQTLDVYIGDMEIFVAPTHTPSKVEYSLHDHRKLRDYQDNAKDFANAEVKDGDHFSKLIAMPTGTGKALDMETPMITEGRGIIPLKEIVIGEEIMAPDGQFTTVLGIFPQGLKERWILRTIDGRDVACDAEHQWEVMESGTMETIIVTTQELSEMVKTKSYSLPFFDPLVYFSERDDYLEVTSTLINVVAKYGYFEGDCLFVQCESEESGHKLVELAHSLGSIAAVCYMRSEGVQVMIQNRFLSAALFDAVHESRHHGMTADEYQKITDRITGVPISQVYQNGVADMTCIEVDHHSHLFVLANFIVTHNTVTSCAIAADNKTRWLISVLPKYAEKWGGDITDNLKLKPKDVMMVETTDQLRGLIDMCKTQGTKKLQPTVVITLTTMATFIKLWQTDPQGCIEDYGCEPMDLCRILDIGMASIDESHEHIASVFLFAMHLHGVKFVCMSGTFLSEDPFVEMIQKVIFPMVKRYDDVKMEKYIDLEFLGFEFKREFRNRIRTSAFGRQDYSHVEFEKSIMKIPSVLQAWLRMIEVMIGYGYMERRVPGDKLVVFAATTEMVNIFVKRFTHQYPDLIIKRYAKTEGDKYKNILEGDITASTLQSSGTAVDIPALITVICTTMVNSAKTNLQMLGRLRNLFGKQMKCLLPFWKSHPKHRSYTAYRTDLFKDRTKSIKTYFYDTELG